MKIKAKQSSVLIIALCWLAYTVALVSGISGPVGSISYAFVAPARKRFSSRAIWVGSDMYGDMVVLAFFLFGMRNKNYLKLKPMLVAYGIREFLSKLQGVVMGTVRTLIMKKIGYVQGLKIGTQDEKTKFWLFALCTVVPLITSALGIIPKFLWPINKQTRERMYYELSERRKKRVEDYLDSVDEEDAPAQAVTAE